MPAHKIFRESRDFKRSKGYENSAIYYALQFMIKLCKKSKHKMYYPEKIL